jgi:hypothetical protein
MKILSPMGMNIPCGGIKNIYNMHTFFDCCIRHLEKPQKENPVRILLKLIKINSKNNQSAHWLTANPLIIRASSFGFLVGV